MRFRYSEWNEQLAQAIQAFKDLMDLFNHLLLQLGGDADRALQYMKHLQQQGYIDDGVDLNGFVEQLQKNKLVQKAQGGDFSLTQKGAIQLRKDVFNHVFSSLKQFGIGDHAISRSGGGGEVLPETRPYEFGDSVQDLDFQRTVHNSLKRGIDEFALRESDFEVFEKEYVTSCATVVMVDVSHSMVLYGEDRITPAKRVAMALAELIMSEYPKDSLDVIAFGDEAWEISVQDLAFLDVGPYHTNTRAGLQLARQILKRRKHTNRQIIMITDGKPSAINEEGGGIYKNSFGLDPRIVNKTLEEAAQCRRAHIPITTFMLARDGLLVDFVEELTKINRGRAYYSSPESLGSFVLVDYIRNRRRKV